MVDGSGLAAVAVVVRAQLANARRVREAARARTTKLRDRFLGEQLAARPLEPATRPDTDDGGATCGCLAGWPRRSMRPPELRHTGQSFVRALPMCCRSRGRAVGTFLAIAFASRATRWYVRLHERVRHRSLARGLSNACNECRSVTRIIQACAGNFGDGCLRTVCREARDVRLRLRYRR
jgi:hypothetical protein